MSLCPSNMMVKGKAFPNYAGRDDIDDNLRKELTDAGLKPMALPWVTEGEVKTKVRGHLDPYGWGFERAWYYWVAKGPGIPPKYATELHKTHGAVVRVDGHCGCPAPLEWFNGFGVGHYHIDTPEGLKALADTLKRVAADAEEELKKETP